VNKATTTSPIADFQNGDHVQIGLRDDAGNAELINEGTAPLFHVEANGAVFFIQNCLFGVSVKSAHPLIRYVLPAGTSSPKPLILNLLGQNQTGNNVVEAGPGAPVPTALSTATIAAASITTVSNTSRACGRE